MLTEYNHPIDYELNINPLISSVIYKQNFTIKKITVYIFYI